MLPFRSFSLLQMVVFKAVPTLKFYMNFLFAHLAASPACYKLLHSVPFVIRLSLLTNFRNHNVEQN